MTAVTRSRPGSHARHKARAGAGTARLTLIMRVMSAVGTVAISSAAALVLVIAIATHFPSRGGQYAAFGHPLLSVLSGSMTPVIRTGDLIIDDPVSSAQAVALKPGQIISFRAAPGSTKILTHRIVARQVIHGVVEYQTKGDANNAPDAALRPATDVVGRLAAVIPRGGYLLAALHQPLVPVLLVVSAVLFFLAGPLFRLARDMDKREDSTTN